MRLSIITIAAAGALTLGTLAGTASAQMVNGLSGPNYMHDAPIGTKAGGAPSTRLVPGEKEAIAGAIRNEMDAKAMQRTSGPVALKTKVSVKTPLFTKNRVMLRKPTTRLDLNSPKGRLDLSSD